MRAKRFVPRSLLGRSLLIILVPLVLVQAVALQIFYGSHLNLVSRRLASSVAGDVAEVIELRDRFPDPRDQAWLMRSAWDQFLLVVRFEPGAMLPPDRHVNVLGPMDDDLAAALRAQVGRPFVMDWRSDPQSIVVRVGLPDGVLTAEVPRKRLVTETIYVFMAWMVGSSLLLFGIAALFMRNQVRAIRRLAKAAEAFGIGRDAGPIKPEGAVEVRRAATAFNRMQERIRRYLTQRTEMLAGVSHDLRTPLTRLRLAIAMLPAADAAGRQDLADMAGDVDEMDRMIGGYLAFARGEGAEETQPVDLAQVLEEVAAGARRTGAAVALAALPGPPLRLRPDAIRRAVTNLVDNARRHANRVALALVRGDRVVFVTVDDDGPGIPPTQRESVFRPFEGGGGGGAGLGLTIARDIVRAHGGDIMLEDSPLGGLRARVRLPV